MKLPFARATKAQSVDAAAAMGIGFNTAATWPDANYESFAREGYSKNEVVYACITEIASSAAEARMALYRETPDGDEEVDDESQLVELLENPTPEMSQFEWLEALQTYLNIAGNVFMFKQRAGRGVVSLPLLRPDRMRIAPSGGFEYTLDGRPYGIADEDIGHLKMFNPTNDFYGLSPLQVLARMVNLDSNQTDFTKVFFQNAGVPSGLLKVKRKLNNQDEANQIRTHWRSQFQGIQNWHRIAVLDEEASYEQMSADLNTMEMPFLRDLGESRICSVFGTPISLIGLRLGMESSSYANRKSDREAFWQNKLMPEYKRMAGFLNRALVADFPELQRLVIKPDLSKVLALQQDADAMSTRLVAQWTAGVITRDEARAHLGYDPAEAGFGAVYRLPLAILEVGPDAPQVQAVFTGGANPRNPLTIEPVNEPAQIAAPSKGWEAKALTARETRFLALFDAQTERLVERMAPEFEAYFLRQKRRADGILGRFTASMPVKDSLPYGEMDIIPPGADAELQAMYRPLIHTVIEAAWQSVNDSGLAGDVAFNPGGVQGLIDSGATRIVRINEATRNAIRQMIQTGLGRGYSLQQMAEGVPGEGFPGIRSLVTELYKNRALTIARTEVRTAQNEAALARYHASGLTHVTASDGSEDPACAARNGQRFTLDEARQQEGSEHPNGTLRFIPVIDLFAGRTWHPAQAEPVVIMPSRLTRKTVQRDAQGFITAVIEEVISGE